MAETTRRQGRAGRRAGGADAPSGLGPPWATDVATDGRMLTTSSPSDPSPALGWARSRRRRRPMAVTATYRVPGAVLTEREHRVPLDHAHPDGRSLTVFTREVAAVDGADRPYLVFLQGGPGFEAARPTSPPSGWMKRALEDYRVLLLDQRGTGRSTPVGAGDPGRQRRGPGGVPGPLPRRLDRRRLRVDPARARGGPLDRARPELRRVHVAHLPVVRPAGPGGGVDHGRAGAGDRPAGGRRVRARRGSGRSRPTPATSPATRRTGPGSSRSGGGWTTRTPSALGRPADRPAVPPGGDLAGRSAGWEHIHHVLELPVGSAAFLHDVEAPARFGRNPIYATLHESSYADGGPTRWSAHRLAPDAYLAGEVLQRRARLPLDVGGLRRRCGCMPGSRSSSPITTGRASTTRPCWR